jgi:hypothetical protein
MSTRFTMPAVVMELPTVDPFTLDTKIVRKSTEGVGGNELAGRGKKAGKAATLPASFS